MSDRRGFIKTGAIVAGGLAISPQLAMSIPTATSQQKLKVGLIGTGSRGTGLMQLMNRIDEIDLVACADILDFRLQDGLNIAPKAEGYLDYKKLLADPKVEAVVISTPLSTHAEIAKAAMEANKHVYCEKTMVKGISEIQEVIDVSKSKPDLIFQTGHQYHSSPLYVKAVEIINAGYIGEITAVHCQWNRNGDWRRPVPDSQYERLINWRMYKEYSGGLVAELMSHQIDFINWFTQSHPQKIVGFGGIDYWKDGRETYDNVHLMMEYPSGLDATFSCTTTNGYEDYKIKVLGSKATIILDYTTGMIYPENSVKKEIGNVDGVSGATINAWQNGEGARIEAPSADPTIDALKQFQKAIQSGGEIISDIKTGATTAKCVQMSLDALYSGEIKYWKDYPELDFG